ncbi:MAG: hypothetical protein IPN76_22570 [Saprospiraceae bacterium]|nr:hypothetical protein [Saprospiraceae bacterium]
MRKYLYFTLLAFGFWPTAISNGQDLALQSINDAYAIRNIPTPEKARVWLLAS